MGSSRTRYDGIPCSMLTQAHALLSAHTTLRLGGPARELVVAERELEILDVLGARGRDRGEPLLVLGGGSNVVVGDLGFPGTVLKIATRGLIFEGSPRGEEALVTAQAGEPWDDLVAECVERGLAGIECLSGIPGLVGAVPMQNVGAYGQDVSETLISLRAFDRERGQVVRFAHADCRFGYRTSVFRGSERHTLLEVTFRLRRGGLSGPLRYAELCRALGVPPGAGAPLARVRDAVLALRRAKGMVLSSDDPDSVSAGSFFTNPVLSAEALAEASRRVSERTSAASMPQYPDGEGRTKLSAAWLIEQAGFHRGLARGPVSLSRKHTLALVNSGGGTARELLALADEIRRGVWQAFGVWLEPEPVLVGVTPPWAAPDEP